MTAFLKRAWAKFGRVLNDRGMRRIDFGLAIVVTIVALVLYSYTEIGRPSPILRFLENVEARSLDARFNLRGTRRHDANILIVGLDEKTLQQVGAFPIPRNAYAKMIDQLSKDGAKVVVFDFNFPVPEKNSALEALQKLEKQSQKDPALLKQIRELEVSSDNDRTLADSIKRSGKIILGQIFLDQQRAESVTAEGADKYFGILSAHTFPLVQTIASGRSFDPVKAWEGATSTDAIEYSQLNASGIYSNIGILAEGAESFGFFNEIPDSDGTFRRTPLLIHYEHVNKNGDDLGAFWPSLDLEALHYYEDISNQDMIAYMTQNGIDHIDLGRHSLRPNINGTMIVNYAGPYLTFPQYSMIDVINGKFSAGTFKDKLVVFGPTAIAIGDVRTTPFHDADYMGVEIHANVIDNLLHSGEPGRGFITHGYREEMIDLFFILALGLGLGYWFSRTRPLNATVGVIVALSFFSLILYAAFARYGMWLSFVVPAGTVFINYAGITSFRMIFEEREKRRVKKMFGSYVSPGVIALMEKNPEKYLKPGGESKRLTVMFSDIRSFTTICEGLTADEVVLLLNQYLGDMTDILFRNRGTLDKYIGDAVMAFWGFPYEQDDDFVRACACALDMRLRLQELNAQWAAQGRRQLAIGIGVNTGEVNVGRMGSTQRMAWTVMGDNVNLASRLEGITKEYHVQCVVSESTYHAAKDHYVFRELDRITVKGKMLPVTIYELMDWARNESLYTERIVRFSEALTAYRRQQWEEAIELFTQLREKFPEDGPSETFIMRSREYMETPPEPDWDGVYAMKTK